MPTPFTHLHITHRLLSDAQVPQTVRQLLERHRADFYLGGCVADQRPEGGRRFDTHFYEYTQPMPDNPWREMLRQYPALMTPTSDAHKVFMMSYVAHLGVDEYWSRNMLSPHFANGDWGEGIRDRFFYLHLLLIYMDERDEDNLPYSVADTMRQSVSQRWLPFLSDSKIGEWRDFIADQLQGESETLRIFGERVRTEPQTIRALLDDPDYMQSHLWQHIMPDLLAEIEMDMYAFARQQMLTYLEEFCG